MNPFDLDVKKKSTNPFDTDSVKTPFDATKLGIAVNTVKGIPRAAKELFFPERGYTDKELAAAKPSFTQNLSGVPKVVSEFSGAIGGVLGSSDRSLASRFAQTPLGGKLADVGAKIQEFGKPKSVEEAAAMRFADVLTFLPVGSLKVTGAGARTIANTRNLKVIEGVLKKEVPGISDEAAKSFGGLLKDVNKTEDVQTIFKRSDEILREVQPTKIAQTPVPQSMSAPRVPPNTTVVPVRQVDLYNYKPKDIQGLGAGASLNIRDMLFSLDNKTLQDVARTGNWGPGVKVYANFHRAEAGKIEFIKSTETRLAQAIKGLPKADRQAIADFRLGITKELPPHLQAANKEITKVTDDIHKQYNAWAKDNGQPEMGYIDDYLTRRAVYEDAFVEGNRGFTDKFTLSRTGGDLPGAQERNLGELLVGYLHTTANKMYMEGAYAQLDDFKHLISKDAPKGAKFVQDFMDNMLQAESQDWLSGAARAVIGARSTSALAFNPVWSLTVQPGSFALTVARNPGLNVISGSLRAARLSPADEAWLKTLPNYKIKTTQTLSTTGVGDVAVTGGKIGSKKEAVAKVMGFIGDRVEETLSRNAAFVAREYAEKKGLKGDALDIYSDLMIGATQSEYIKSARAKALRSLLVRFLIPFQTYAFEVYRFGKTIVGKSGGLPLEKSDRVIQAFTFAAAVYTYDWLQSKVSGRKITSANSFIPLFGAVADYARAQITGKGQRIGRSPVAPLGELDDATRAITKAFDGNGTLLRKQMIKWGLGFAKIGGGSTFNRLIDGLIANSKGFQTTASGNEAFEVTGTDRIISPILGPYGTMAGRKYIEELNNPDKKEPTNPF